MFFKPAAWIPRHVRNITVIRFFEFLRHLPQFGKYRRKQRLARNRAAFPLHAAALQLHGGYIENQHAFEDLRFGRTNLSYAGCEIIAVYNALYSLGQTPDLPELISRFEKDGMVLSGGFGTSPRALRDYFTQKGYRTDFMAEEPEFAALLPHASQLILTFYNDRNNIFAEVHTIHIEKRGDVYIAHNAHSGSGPLYAGSFDALLKKLGGGNAKAISLLAIYGKGD